MVKNILQYLEKTVESYPDKIAFTDINREVTYKEIMENAQKLGTHLSKKNTRNSPIAIIIDKTVECLEAMFGVLYSGNFYTVIDTKSPIARIKLILDTLEPIAVITDQKNLGKVETYVDQNIYVYEKMINEKMESAVLCDIRRKMIDTDPMYVLFTSGSTGIPKGTVISHRAVIAYANWVTKTFDITSETIWGSQTPFYFSMSITDVFSTVLSGATFHIIPKSYFSFPIKLLEFIKEKGINSIYWVPSALSLVANFKALEEVEIPNLKKVLFAGEVMPTKQLNEWIKKLPDALFANLFGPTETTDICTYYIVNRKFENTENLPIGQACDNCDILVIKEDGTEAKLDEAGELCVRGSFLASGYYRNMERTLKAFVQNPLNKKYPEIIYKTGDIVKYNKDGELMYLSRKDFQIKHMGYRIELGEIETAVNNIEGVIICACIYDKNNSKIVMYYQGENLNEKDLLAKTRAKLPVYMCPSELVKLQSMPYNANGKIDRNKLKEMLEN
mgnify:FL=1